MPTWVPFLTSLTTLALIYGLLALGLNLHYGYAGLLNFGHVAFFAAGAFASALATLPPPGSPAYVEAIGQYQVGFGQPFVVGLLVAGILGGVLAFLIGATSVRLHTHYLAIATFALAEIFRTFLSNEEWLTRGEYGISTVPQPLKGNPIPVSSYPYAYLGLTLLVVAVLFVLIQRLTDSPFGRVLRGIRADEVAARALGKDTPRMKLKAFVIGGVLAGMAGSLWTHSVGAVHVGQFVPIVTFQVWLAMLLGGAGNNLGVIVGAFVLIAFRESTRFLSDIPGLSSFTTANPTFIPSLRFVVIGLLLILVIRLYPDGIFPERKRKALARAPVPSDPGSEAEAQPAGKTK